MILEEEWSNCKLSSKVRFLVVLIAHTHNINEKRKKFDDKCENVSLTLVVNLIKLINCTTLMLKNCLSAACVRGLTCMLFS